MTAPLIVHSHAELRDDRQDVVLMLHDFTFRTPVEVLAGLTGTSVAAAQAIAQKTEQAPAAKSDAHMPEARLAGMAGGAPRMAMPGKAESGPGAMQMHMDLNDVQYDAFLANDRTLADPQIVRVERGGHIRLRVINGASSSRFGSTSVTSSAVQSRPTAIPYSQWRAAVSRSQWPNASTS